MWNEEERKVALTIARYVGPSSSQNGCVTHDAPSSFTGGRKTYDKSNASFQRILRCSILNNVSTFNESSKWVCDDDGEKVRMGNIRSISVRVNRAW